MAVKLYPIPEQLYIIILYNMRILSPFLQEGLQLRLYSNLLFIKLIKYNLVQGLVFNLTNNPLSTLFSIILYIISILKKLSTSQTQLSSCWALGLWQSSRLLEALASQSISFFRSLYRYLFKSSTPPQVGTGQPLGGAQPQPSYKRFYLAQIKLYQIQTYP